MPNTNTDSLKDELRRRTRQFRAMKERNDELISDAKVLHDQLEKTQESNSYFQESKRAEMRFDALKFQIADLHRKRKVLLHKIDLLTKSVEAETNRADSLQTQLETVCATQKGGEGNEPYNSLKTKALKLQKENIVLEETNDKLNRRMEELEAAVLVGSKATDDNVVTLKNRISELEYHALQNRDIHSKHTPACGAQMQELGSTDNVLDFAQERQQLNDRINMQKETLKKRKAENQLLRESCENAYKETEIMKKQMLSKPECPQTFDNADTKAEMFALREGAKQYKRERVRMDQQIKSLQKQMHELKNSVPDAEMHMRCKEQHDVIQNLHREAERLKEQHAALQCQQPTQSAEIAADDSHVKFLTKNAEMMEQQTTQMLQAMEGIEINASTILANAEVIVGYKGADERVTDRAKVIKKSSVKILKMLESFS